MGKSLPNVVERMHGLCASEGGPHSDILVSGWVQTRARTRSVSTLRSFSKLIYVSSSPLRCPFLLRFPIRKSNRNAFVRPNQPTNPQQVQKASKMVCDLVRQCEQVGELRSAIKAGAMTRDDVYAEIGDVVNGDKPGRVGEELILVDLTGTGAQDAAIGQVAWDILSKK